MEIREPCDLYSSAIVRLWPSSKDIPRSKRLVLVNTKKVGVGDLDQLVAEVVRGPDQCSEGPRIERLYKALDTVRASAVSSLSGKIPACLPACPPNTPLIIVCSIQINPTTPLQH